MANFIRQITHRPLWVNIVIGLGLAVILFFLVILSLRLITRHGKSRTVPSVLGKSFDDAQRELQDLGFEVVIQDSIYQDTLPRFSVIKQVPEGDAVVKVNRTIYLTINRAVPPEVTMPNLISYSFRNAEMQLLSMGLRVGDTTFKPDFAKLTVLEQRHNGQKIVPGTKIRMGSYIDLVLSSGVGRTEFVVPNLIGMRYGDAKDQLEASGIIVIPIVNEVTDTLNAFIYKQEPERFSVDGRLLRIRPGQLMTVFLSPTKPVVDTTQYQLPDYDDGGY